MEEQISVLKGAMPYIRRYRNQTFVIKLGGAVLANQETARQVAAQCTLLYDLGIRVVIVHGGGPQASRLSRELGIEPAIVAGRRITDDRTLEIIKMVCAGQINTDLVAALRSRGALPVGLSGIDAGLIVAERRPPVSIKDDEGKERLVDFENVGDIRSVNPEIIRHLLDGSYLPVIACLSADAEGNALNINADTVSEALAVALKANKLIFLTDRKGVLRDQGDESTLIPFADADDLKTLLDENTIIGGMRLKVEACLRATSGGVKRTHILDGTSRDSLLVELFTGAGCGTMIVVKREKQLYQEKELG
jgi:acetylglutamate kinase